MCSSSFQRFRTTTASRTGNPIGYWSRYLEDAQRTKDLTQYECIAVLCAVLLQTPYLEAIWFKIRTSYDGLHWTLDLVDASGKLVPSRLSLSEFEFDVAHRFGIKHQDSDALLRLPNSEKDTGSLNDELSVLKAGTSG